MTRSLFEHDGSPAPESWRRIRSLRADPDSVPRRGLQKDRGRVFQAALEQAQQQFTAAAAIGYESRPLNLFYGLSQAGRAIAAASTRLGAVGAEPGAVSWRASGHGLHMDDEPIAPSFFESVVKVATGRRDLFSRVSIALGSPVNMEKVSLGALVSQIPEYQLQFGVEGDGLPELHILGLTRAVPYSDRTAMDFTFPQFGAITAYTPEEVMAVVRRYPALEGFGLRTGNMGTPGANNDMQFGQHVYLEVNPAEFEFSRDGLTLLPQGWRFYRGHQLFFPRIADSTADLHPLASWWIVLYGSPWAPATHPRHGPH
ncbi:hypothetical protein GCM10028798_34060 [Humibacter antri]